MKLTNDIYDEMCRLSPVQKKHRKLNDSDVTFNPDEGELFGDRRYYWRLRQEDWQDILFEFEIDSVDASLFDFEEFAECLDLNNGISFDFFFNKVKRPSEAWTILWCLYTNKTVYGLTWDWKRNRWKNV